MLVWVYKCKNATMLEITCYGSNIGSVLLSISGVCTAEACESGWWGEKCDKQCPSDCAMNPSTLEFECDFQDGRCQHGCDLNQYGPHCIQTCHPHCGLSDVTTDNTGKSYRSVCYLFTCIVAIVYRLVTHIVVCQMWPQIIQVNHIEVFVTLSLALYTDLSPTLWSVRCDHR